MNARLALIPPALLVALVACANPEPAKTAQASSQAAPEGDCVAREVAIGSNMVRRVGCSKANVTEAEATRERLTALPTRSGPEPGAR